MNIETVEVVAEITEENPSGYMVINKSDMTDKHKLFVKAAHVEKSAHDFDPSKMSVQDLHVELKRLGVKFDEKMQKPQLIALLIAAK